MSELNAVFEQMQQRFNPSAASGMDSVFQYRISDAGDWHVRIADDQCSISEGSADDADVTLTLDSNTLKEIMSGETDGMQAFMSGRISADGDVMLAARLGSIFPVS